MTGPIYTHFANAPRLGDILAPERNSLNLMRLMLALLVLVSHGYLYLSGTPDGEPLSLSTGHALGEYAVQAFFILSGLMVAQSFCRSRSALDFAVARGLRIFPALIVCVTLSALLLGPFVTTLSLRDYFTNGGVALYVAKTLSLSTGMAGLPGAFEDNPLSGGVNTSLWTLKYEVICYIALAAAGLAGMFEARWRGIVMAALAAFIALVFYNPPVEAELFTFADNIRYFSVFFGAGVLAYLTRDRLILSGFLIAPLFAMFLATRFGAASEIGSALFLGYLALWASTKPFGPLRAFANRSDLSYGVYIYAGPVQQTLIHFAPGLAPATLTIAAMLITAPLAMASWTIVERPASRLRSVISGMLAPRRAARAGH